MKNKKGFTIAETLISLSLYSVLIIPLVMGPGRLFKYTYDVNKTNTQVNNYFIVKNSIQSDINNGKDFVPKITGTDNSFTINGINYELKDNDLYRNSLQLTKKGNNIELNMKKRPYSIKISNTKTITINDYDTLDNAVIETTNKKGGN